MLATCRGLASPASLGAPSSYRKAVLPLAGVRHAAGLAATAGARDVVAAAAADGISAPSSYWLAVLPRAGDCAAIGVRPSALAVLHAVLPLTGVGAAIGVRPGALAVE